MSYVRPKPRLGRVAPRQQRDSLGRKLCRNCPRLVAKGRSSYCSKECATDFEIKYFPSRTRSHVYCRDRGVCAKCGCDTDKIRRVIKWVKHFNSECLAKYGYEYDWIRKLQAELGFTLSLCGSGDFWQVDHIHEVARGGWGSGLDKLRTLCTPCHRAETARLARELADERKRAKQPQLFAA